MAETQEADSKTVHIESFSYSWLVNFPSLENLNGSGRTSADTCDTCDDSSSFIEMDPKLPPSRRFSIGPNESFKFDFTVSQCPLVHADELFCNGRVMPAFAVGSKEEEDSEPSDQPGMNPEAGESSRRFPRASKRTILKHLDFFKPLCRRIFGRRTGSRGKNGNSKKRVYSEETSQRMSGDDWRLSCDSESSIYEAVLHCKKSFGKQVN